MSRSGRRPRPAGRPARQAGSSARPTPGSTPGRTPGSTPGRTQEPVPLETGRARAVLTGLFLFAGGFAVAAVDLFLQGFARPVYLVAVTVGLVGIGVVGFFLDRGTVPRPEVALWSPTGLRVLTRSLGLPAMPVAVAFYALVAVGVVGNFVVPMFFRR